MMNYDEIYLSTQVHRDKIVLNLQRSINLDDNVI